MGRFPDKEFVVAGMRFKKLMKPSHVVGGRREIAGQFEDHHFGGEGLRHVDCLLKRLANVSVVLKVARVVVVSHGLGR